MQRLLVAMFLALSVISPTLGADPLRTVAEKTDYKATSRYADVVAFCDDLAKQSPTVKVSTFGTSHEGRKLPLLVLADPTVSSAAEAEKAGKLVVLVFANIHAGEVDGKEAVLALARDLTAEKGHPLLKDLVILIVPIFNADGNEPIAKTNRTEQHGPEGGVGIRENLQGFDLNRDFVKLESPEVRALVKLINTWDPAIVIDCHTTNGSKHRFTLTHDGPRYPTTDGVLPEWVRGKMLPEVGLRVKKATGFDTGPYGNFNAARTKWETYPATPRFGVQYVALRGRIGILSESYSYASFEDRVRASYAFVKACLEVAAEKKAEVRQVIDQPVSEKGRPDMIPVRTKVEAFPGKRTILGFEEEQKDGKRVTTDRPKDYALDDVSRVVATEVIKRPATAYLIPADQEAAIKVLRLHGIKVEELREDIELEVEVYKIQSTETAARAFQSHQTRRVEAARRTETRRVPAKTVVVRTTQPLGSLAAYLLEPHSEDGLTTWNFFDKDLGVGKDFPVLRLSKAVPLTVGPPAPGRADDE